MQFTHEEGACVQTLLCYLVCPTDMDECLKGNVCGSRACVNTEGSYHCECQTGFMYSRVSKKCEGEVQYLLMITVRSESVPTPIF